MDNVLNCSIVKLALEVSMGGREELVEDSEAVDNVLNCSIVKLALEVSMAEGGTDRGFRDCGQCPQLFHCQAGSRGQYGRGRSW